SHFLSISLHDALPIYVLTGEQKFTLGVSELMEGVPFIPLLVGMFAISEVLILIIDDLQIRYVTDTKNVKNKISFKEFKYIQGTRSEERRVGKECRNRR